MAGRQIIAGVEERRAGVKASSEARAVCVAWDKRRGIEGTISSPVGGNGPERNQE